MQLYNSLTKTTQTFTPLSGTTVKMYVCGITPYDTTHLGHAFVYIFFDALRRYLEYQGYQVIYTQNVTDIDDDILKRAKRDNQNWVELGNFWTNKFVTDTKNLNIIPPTHYIKATDSINKIIDLVKSLVAKGFAYEKQGNVYFSVDKFSEYGKLSKYSTEEMIELSKERGANPDDPNKQNPLDFILWQKSLDDEPSWESPWGAGRPGWHIECSAMIHETLGDQIDIHGGGFDLIYPHHESEIAQSESVTEKKPFVSTWMHVAMLSYQGEKMSKSLGNLVLVSELLKTYTANEVRFLLLSYHYRSAWEFKEAEMKNVVEKVGVIQKALTIQLNKSNTLMNEREKKFEKQFFQALDNDMDTPTALDVLGRLAESVLQKQNPQSQQLLKKLSGMLGFELPLL